MYGANADGIEYLPDNCKDLPHHLRLRATEVLFFKESNPDARNWITHDMIERARARHRALEEAPVWNLRTSRSQAISELDELEDARKRGRPVQLEAARQHQATISALSRRLNSAKFSSARLRMTE